MKYAVTVFSFLYSTTAIPALAGPAPTCNKVVASYNSTIESPAPIKAADIVQTPWGVIATKINDDSLKQIEIEGHESDYGGSSDKLFDPAFQQIVDAVSAGDDAWTTDLFNVLWTSRRIVTHIGGWTQTTMARGYMLEKDK